MLKDKKQDTSLMNNNLKHLKIFFLIPYLVVVIFLIIQMYKVDYSSENFFAVNYNFIVNSVLVISFFSFLVFAIYDIAINKDMGFLYTILMFVVLAFALSFVMQLFQMDLSFSSTIEWIKNKSGIYMLNTLVIFSVFLLLASLTSTYWGVVIGFIVIGALSVVNFLKLKILGQPLYPVDFYQVKNLGSFVDFLSLDIRILISLVVAFVLFIVLLSLKFREFKIRKIYLALSFLCCVGVIGSSISPFDINAQNIYTKAGAVYCGWNQPHNYKENGFIFAMLSNLQSKTMEKPENYNEEVINEIVKKYSEKAAAYNSGITESAEKPNIIYVMSESLWDPTSLEFLNFDADPLENIKNFSDDNYIYGSLLSPEFGGNTANVEFELLTGMAMYNINKGSIPYQQSVSKFFPSVVDLLKDEGYKTYALHPNSKAFYKRSYVYENFGIDNFIGIDDMVNIERMPGGYVDDYSITKEIKRVLEENDEPIFMHAVTIQNHMNYDLGKNGEESIGVTWDGFAEGSQEEFESYSEGIKHSDLAIKELMDFVKDYDKPTMVVFFGDHLPVTLRNTDVKESDFMQTMSDDEKEVFASTTPLFYYANFDIKDEEISMLGSNFISSTAYRLMNKKLPPYYAMLEALNEQFNGMKNHTFINKNTENSTDVDLNILLNSNNELVTSLSPEQKEILDEYKLIQYDIIEGKRFSLEEFFKVKD